jgi:prolyl-tRNA synthetase
VLHTQTLVLQYLGRDPTYGLWLSIPKKHRSHDLLEWFNAQIKALDVQNAYFPMFVSAKVLEREKDHIEGFSPEVAWVTKAFVPDIFAERASF